MKLHKKFLEAQTPPPVDVFSIDNIDWYNEMIDRCFNGYSYRGTRITGDHFFYLNFFPIMRVIMDSKGNPTKHFDLEFPLWSQEDDYLMKQMEEAEQDSKAIFLFTGRGFGKCLAPDTPVRMFDGSVKKVFEIKVGDQVMGPDSKPRNVLVTYEGEDEMYEIQQNGGMTYTVNSQHTLSLKRKNSAFCSEIVKGVKKNYHRYPQYGDIANIDIQDVIQKPKKFLDVFSGYKVPLEFPEKHLHLDPYYLGLWLGDGSSHRPGITTANSEIVEYIYRFAKKYRCHVNINNSKGERCPTYHLSTKRGLTNPILEKLKRIKVLRNKHIPDDYKYNSKENRLQLLAGLIDSDGYYKNGCYEICSKQKKLAYDIYDLASTLGFRCKMYEKPVNGKDYYRIGISGYTDKIPVKLERKKSVTVKNKDPYLTGIKSITPVGKGKYNGFTIDGDSLFCLEDGTVTHNTYMVISIAAKTYYLIPMSHSVISGSLDDHAGETFSKLKTGMTGLEKVHPTLFYNRLTDNTDLVKSGYYEYIDGKKQESGMLSVIEKIIYGDKPGKSKGRRLNFQQFEEAGDWSGPAPLKDCIAASEGTWKVGSIMKCRVFYTGTGGTVKSRQAKDIFFNPEAFNLYTVREWKDRPTGIVVPAYRKLGGYWEKTGISDIEGAKAYLEAERIRKKDDPVAYTKFIQEYPFNPDEMFMISGVNNFDQSKIADQYTKVTTMLEYKRGTYGKLEWTYDEKGKRNGVQWIDDPNGKLWKLEDPEKDEDGNVYPHLYIAGYDGIDLGEQDTESGKGSQGATSVKKRLLTTNRTNNIYVMFYVDRPNDIDELYETNLMISWYYNCLFNIEDTKRGIVAYWKNLGEYNRFMKRPRLTLTDPTVAFNNTNLIGVTNAPKNYQYGEEFLIRYVKYYCEHIFFAPALEQFRDFTMENRTEFDIIVSMMMAELGDDELMDKHVIPEKPNYELEEEYGYYTDANGVKRYGVIPKTIDPMQFQTPDFLNYIDYIDLANREAKYN